MPVSDAVAKSSAYTPEAEDESIGPDSFYAQTTDKHTGHIDIAPCFSEQLVMGIDQFIVHIHLSPGSGSDVSCIIFFQPDDLFQSAYSKNIRLFVFFASVKCILPETNGNNNGRRRIDGYDLYLGTVDAGTKLNTDFLTSPLMIRVKKLLFGPTLPLFSINRG